MTDNLITITEDSKLLTPSQKHAIKMLRSKHAPRDGYEFKHNEIATFSDYTKLVFLQIETGLTNDAGTMAAVFGRDRYHFMIGKRGGIKSHDGDKWQKILFRDSDWASRNKRLAENK